MLRHGAPDVIFVDYSVNDYVVIVGDKVPPNDGSVAHQDMGGLHNGRVTVGRRGAWATSGHLVVRRSPLHNYE